MTRHCDLASDYYRPGDTLKGKLSDLGDPWSWIRDDVDGWMRIRLVKGWGSQAGQSRRAQDCIMLLRKLLKVKLQKRGDCCSC